MTSITLSPDMQALLDRIRHHPEPLNIDDLDPDLLQQAVEAVGKVYLADRPMTRIERNAASWFLTELSRVLRAHVGWDLAYELEFTIRKWAKFGLPTSLAQELICACYSKLALPAPETERAQA